jgi:hypothetical protein
VRRFIITLIPKSKHASGTLIVSLTEEIEQLRGLAIARLAYTYLFLLPCRG